MWLFYLYSTVKIRLLYLVFPLAESIAKAFCWLFLWNFKEKASTIFYDTALFLEILKEQPIKFPNMEPSSGKWRKRLYCCYPVEIRRTHPIAGNGFCRQGNMAEGIR